MIENTIPILRVRNLAASLDYYERTLGFTTDWSSPDFAGVTRDGCHIYLAQGDQGQPGAWLWVGLHDVDAMYEECRSRGANIRSEIVSHPWAREFQVEDPDGNVLRLGGEPAQ